MHQSLWNLARLLTLWLFWRKIYTTRNKLHSRWLRLSQSFAKGLQLNSSSKTRGIEVSITPSLPQNNTAWCWRGAAQRGKMFSPGLRDKPLPTHLPTAPLTQLPQVIAGVIAETLLPMQRGWVTHTRWVLKVRSNPNYCMILWFYDSQPSIPCTGMLQPTPHTHTSP